MGTSRGLRELRGCRLQAVHSGLGSASASGSSLSAGGELIYWLLDGNIEPNHSICPGVVVALLFLGKCSRLDRGHATVGRPKKGHVGTGAPPPLGFEDTIRRCWKTEWQMAAGSMDVA